MFDAFSSAQISDLSERDAAAVNAPDVADGGRSSLPDATALHALSPAERLVSLREAIAGPIVFTHGFGMEGQLLVHWIAEHDIDIDIVALDTGRLFPETHDLWALTEARYGRRIRAIYPDATSVEALIAKNGTNGFYNSKEARESCCDVRKTRPLDRALAGASAWISGVRADQNANRSHGGLIGRDVSRGILKLNPLYDWTRERVAAEIKAHDVPINALHARGFASIGCAPCTRAIAPDENERSGRWWWENDETRECGLHLPRRRAANDSEPKQPAALCGCG